MIAYIIYEDERLMNGEIYHTKESLWRNIGWAKHNAKVFEIDFSEACRDGSTQMRDVTEDMVHGAYYNGDIDAEKHAQNLPGMFITFGERK